MIKPPRNSLTTRFLRTLRLSWHLTIATWIIIFRFPKIDEATHTRIVHEWTLKLLHIFALRVVVKGEKPEGSIPKNVLLVCNHVSWLDIFAIFTTHVPRFIAKKEIEYWPIFGRIIKSAGTLFIDRENKRNSFIINEQMAKTLGQGNCIAVFPESTTSDGSTLLPFKTSLFESALIAKSTIQPIAIRYLDAYGYFTTQPAYYADITFLGSIWRILCMPSGIIEMTFCEPINVAEIHEADRFLLSANSRSKIQECFDKMQQIKPSSY